MPTHEQIEAAYRHLRRLHGARDKMNELVLEQLADGLKDYMRWPPGDWIPAKPADMTGPAGMLGRSLKIVAMIEGREIPLVLSVPPAPVRGLSTWRVTFEGDESDVDIVSQSSLNVFYDKSAQKIAQLAEDLAEV
jgi:hypothetical protein